MKGKCMSCIILSLRVGADYACPLVVHDPHGQMPKVCPTFVVACHDTDSANAFMKTEFKKLGYPEPIIDHHFARDRAIRRFKNVGDE